ncbi:hypothetical protein, partial [Microvirga sp. KLBC 81]|uniref:hypothetical protein n=1 Tax=Microvirga sp. KLBC 81 TaxID=1862707 RepID=UPI00197B89FB
LQDLDSRAKTLQAQSNPPHAGTEHLAHRAEPQVRVSEKWIRFAALNDALIQGESIGWVPKVQIRFSRPRL